MEEIIYENTYKRGENDPRRSPKIRPKLHTVNQKPWKTRQPRRIDDKDGPGHQEQEVIHKRWHRTLMNDKEKQVTTRNHEAHGDNQHGDIFTKIVYSFSSLLSPVSKYSTTRSVRVIPLLIAIILALAFNSGLIIIDSCVVPGLGILSSYSFVLDTMAYLTSYFSVSLYICFSISIFLHFYIENYKYRNLHNKYNEKWTNFLSGEPLFFCQPLPDSLRTRRDNTMERW